MTSQVRTECICLAVGSLLLGASSFVPRCPHLCLLGPAKTSPSSFLHQERGHCFLPLAGQLPLGAGHRSVPCRRPLSLGLVTSEDCCASWAVERGTLAPEPQGPQRSSHALLGSLQWHSSGEGDPLLPCGVGGGRAEHRVAHMACGQQVLLLKGQNVFRLPAVNG